MNLRLFGLGYVLGVYLEQWPNNMYYLPPPASPYEALMMYHNISATLDLLQIKYPDAGVVILGDFNQANTDLICQTTGLRQVVNTPTRGLAVMDNIT